MIDAEAPNPRLQAERYFVENMVRMRENRGWSQTELARKMVDAGWSSYNQMTVSRTEKFERPLRLSEAESIATLFGSSLESMMMEPELGALESELSYAYNLLAESFGKATTELGRLVDARNMLSDLLRADDMAAAIGANDRLKDLASVAATTLEATTVEHALSVARREPVPYPSPTDQDPHGALDRFLSAKDPGAEGS